MKQINRRQFGKFLGGAALAPFGSGLVVPLPRALAPGPRATPQNAAAAGIYPHSVGRPARAEQQPDAPKAEPPTQSGQAPLKLTPEQEGRVKQAIERRERQLAAIRNRALPYDAEPAFVFRVRAGS